MQSRGAIIVFAIAFALVCLFQLSFSFFTAKVESDAQSYAYDEETYSIAERLAGGDELKKAYLVDSIAKAREAYYLDNEAGSYNILIRKYSYKEAKERELNLGLDLKGGMHLVLEVDKDMEPGVLAQRLAKVHNMGAIKCTPEQKGAIQARLGTNEGAIGADEEEPMEGSRFLGNVNHLAL